MKLYRSGMRSVVGVDLIDRQPPDRRFGKGLKRIAPLRDVLGISPACLVRAQELLHALVEARRSDVALAMSQRVDPVRQEETSGCGFLSYDGESNGAGTAQTHFAQPAVATIEENPFPPAIIGDGKIKAATIGMLADFGQCLHLADVQAIDLSRRHRATSRGGLARRYV